MPTKTTLLLNLLVLLVNFALVCAGAYSGQRVLRATTRTAMLPVSQTLPARENRVRDGAMVTIPHTTSYRRLVRYLAAMDGSSELTVAQREGLFDALAHCCRGLGAAARRLSSEHADARAEQAQVTREVEQRLRAASIEDPALLARLVRVVVSSAG